MTQVMHISLFISFLFGFVVSTLWWGLMEWAHGYNGILTDLFTR